jgi:A/G-specific adenine glycosylase
MDEHKGEFPQDFEQIQALSGIGRSTAAELLPSPFNKIKLF